MYLSSFFCTQRKFHLSKVFLFLLFSCYFIYSITEHIIQNNVVVFKKGLGGGGGRERESLVKQFLFFSFSFSFFLNRFFVCLRTHSATQIRSTVIFCAVFIFARKGGDGNSKDKLCLLVGENPPQSWFLVETNPNSTASRFQKVDSTLSEDTRSIPCQ